MHPRQPSAPILALVGCALSISYTSLPVRAAGVSQFDGTWNVTIGCAHAPDGALPYSWELSAVVRDGNLLGYYRKPGMVPSGTLSGHIDADGSAQLSMQGLTGNRSYTIDRVNPGTPFHYSVTAQFDRNHGSGKRNEMRHCDLDFIRE